jgi:monothiol glutaredoxin
MAGETTVDVDQRIEKQLETYPVLLYMKGTPDFPQCGVSARVVAALRALDAHFAFVNIFDDPEVREGLKAYSNWPTFPQLYVKGELIGGCDIAVEMYESGELAELLSTVPAAQADSAAATESS